MQFVVAQQVHLTDSNRKKTENKKKHRARDEDRYE